MIPLIMHTMQSGSVHQMKSQKRGLGLAVAEEGLAYAIRQFSTTDATQLIAYENGWRNALAGTFSSTLYPDCNSGNLVTGPSGGKFKLICNRDSMPTTAIREDQISVIVTAYLPAGTQSTTYMPERAIQAYLSRKAMTASLPTGESVDAALLLVNTPRTGGGAIGVLPSNSLIVHWGPIVNFYSDPSDPEWSLTGTALDSAIPIGLTTPRIGFPRKVSNGPITGAMATRAPAPAGGLTVLTPTDNAEYWAYASATMPPPIDTDRYRGIQTPNSATYTTCGSQFFTCPSGPCSHMTATWGPAPNDTCSISGNVLLDKPVTAGGSSNPTRLVYIDGNAQMQGNAAYDLTETGALIIMGDLVLSGTPNGGTNLDIRTPKRASLEYPRRAATSPWQPTDVWPCRDAVGTDCQTHSTASATKTGFDKFQFRGFLYVRGNLIITGNPTSPWEMVGGIWVGDEAKTPVPDGRLIIDNNTNANVTSLRVWYDDRIVPYIRTKTVEVKVDTRVEVAGR